MTVVKHVVNVLMVGGVTHALKDVVLNVQRYKYLREYSVKCVRKTLGNVKVVVETMSTGNTVINNVAATVYNLQEEYVILSAVNVYIVVFKVTMDKIAHQHAAKAVFQC